MVINRNNLYKFSLSYSTLCNKDKYASVRIKIKTFWTIKIRRGKVVDLENLVAMESSLGIFYRMDEIEPVRQKFFELIKTSH